MQDTSRGIEVVGNSIINSDNRWVTIHDSNGILVKNNVGHKSIGHGFFLESGSEFDNVFDGNIGIQTLSGNLISSDRQASVFWSMNPSNSYKNNVAVNGLYYGFHFSIPNVSVQSPDKEKVNLSSLSNLEFENNVAYNYRHAGLVIDRPKLNDDPIEDQTITVSKFKAWNEYGRAIGQWGIRIFGQDIVVKDSQIFDSSVGIELRGKDNTVENTNIKIINLPSQELLVAGIVISGQDMIIKDSVIQGYIKNEISSASDIIINNDHNRKELLSAFIIDTSLNDPRPIYFGNPVNSKSFLQVYGYNAPNGPNGNYPNNLMLQKINFDDINQDEKSIDLNFMAKVSPLDDDNNFVHLEMFPELVKRI